jgi:hypothetical protein
MSETIVICRTAVDGRGAAHSSIDISGRQRLLTEIQPLPIRLTVGAAKISVVAIGAKALV